MQLKKQTLHHSLFLTAILSLLVLTGCQSYNSQSSDMYAAWHGGDATTAAYEVTKRADKAQGGRDELLWRLEQGTVLSTAGDIEGSNLAFDQAEEIVDRYEEEAKVKVGSKTASLFTNQTVMPYRGRAYDKIMMNTYKALNYLMAGDNDAARVELNRALQRQKDAVTENQKRIEKAIEQAEASKEGNLTNEDGTSAPSYDVERAKQDPAFASANSEEMNRIEERILPYADYVNPFSVFLDGLYFTHLGLDNADIERARKSFERVNSMSPGSYIEQDLAMAESMAEGGQADTVTYVIFSSGSAPVRDELRIDIPLFLVSSVSYVGAAFPKLQFSDNYVAQVSASSSSGELYTTERLSSMDSVIAKDFKNEWPAIVTNTLLTTATKALAGYLMEESVKNEDWKVRLFAKAMNVGFQAATNQADLRTWKTLPKQYSYLRMPTPADGIVNLKVGMFDSSVEVAPGKTNIVMVRSVNSTAAPYVSQFTLN